MTFREYRPTGTIRAAVITEDTILLQPHDAPPDADLQPYGKGDYAQRLDTGKLVGWTKADFEAAYRQVHVRQPQPKKARKKAAAAGGSAPSE